VLPASASEPLRPAFLAHHFDTPKQQLEASKLGMWLFLTTEVLFFSGLFCAYIVFRSSRPEVFYWSHFFLDTRLGAVNTCVLLVSSFTAAYAVRAAQLAQRRRRNRQRSPRQRVARLSRPCCQRRNRHRPRLSY